MFKPTFFQLILPEPTAGTSIHECAKLAASISFPMFSHNGSVYSTEHFKTVEAGKWGKAKLFDLSDLIQR